MAKREVIDKTQKITAKTLEAAVRRCAKGEQYEVTDAHCLGLQLRVHGKAVTWTVRARIHGKQRRWTLGGPDLIPEIARERASEVRGWCRRGMDPEKLVVQFTTGIPIAHQVRVGGEKPLRSWTWIQAVDRFLDQVRGCRAPDTYDDYARTLGGIRRLAPVERHSRIAELARFDGRAVATIKREEIAECIAEVCKRAHRQGQHLRSVLGSMWSFLGDDAQRKETSVQPNLLLRLKNPEKPFPAIVRSEPAELQLFENERRPLPFGYGSSSRDRSIGSYGGACFSIRSPARRFSAAEARGHRQPSGRLQGHGWLLARPYGRYRLGNSTLHA
jgi:hypothetical protein